ncbi:hypothetical protein NT05LI_2951a, partial [Listeria ivanovii FSL F6-596]
VTPCIGVLGKLSTLPENSNKKPPKFSFRWLTLVTVQSMPVQLVLRRKQWIERWLYDVK